MFERAIDRAYLDGQYGTEERLRIRLEAHQRYSERPDDFFEWVLDRLDPQPGDLLVDVGCGVGSIHPSCVPAACGPFWAWTLPGPWSRPANARQTTSVCQ